MSEPDKVHTFQAHEVALTSVTVFNDRAEIKRTLTVKLVPGINEVLIENVAKKTLPGSLKVDGRGAAVIHDVQFQRVPTLPEEGLSPKVKELVEQRKELELKKNKGEDRQGVLKRRVEVLDEMLGKVGGGAVELPSNERSQPFTLNEESFEGLNKLFSFYEVSSVEVRRKLREVDEEVRCIDEELGKLNRQISIAQSEDPTARLISVLMESSEGGVVDLDVSYQVKGARWSPSYDIRIDSANDTDSDMKITYFGTVVQSSGEDWIDAPLVLSTAQPSFGGNLPVLGTQTAVFFKPPPPHHMRKSRAVSSSGLFGGAQNMMVERCAVANAPPMGFASVAAAPVGASDTVLATTFVIARPATIPSDSSEHKITVTSLEMKPVMIHEVIPCKATNVYLTASVINSSRYPFLHGPANVYLNNSFVAKSTLKAVSPNERFTCSLGVDPAVKIEYRPVHTFSEQVGLISKSSSTAHEQRIMVKNTKNINVLITVKEHVPKSTDDKIKIKVFSPELDPKTASEVDPLKKGELPKVGARMNSAHNLEWTVNIEPNSEKELLVKWTVDHPNAEKVEFREQF